MHAIPKALAAAVKNCDPTDARLVLRGVLVSNGKVVATDGYRLIEISVNYDGETMLLDGGQLKKCNARLKKADIFTIEKDGNKCILNFAQAGKNPERVIIDLLDGEYPNYEPTIPRHDAEAGEAELDAGYLLDMTKSFQLLGVMPKVKSNAHKYTPTTFNAQGVTGIIMPRRV